MKFGSMACLRCATFDPSAKRCRFAVWMTLTCVASEAGAKGQAGIEFDSVQSLKLDPWIEYSLLVNEVR